MNRGLWVGATLLFVGIIGILGTSFLLTSQSWQPDSYVSYPMGQMPMAGQPLSPGTRPISLDRAVELAQQYVASLGESDLAVKEVMEFELNFYFIVYEKSTGAGAFEMIIDRYGGWIRPEPGPNMMWNTKYGMMGGGMGMMGRGGMMGWYRGAPTTDVPVTREQAEQHALEYLKGYLPGTTIEEPDVFYGYYTIHVLKDGKVYGMLSVNGYTGQVWYHSWHGSFIAMKEFQ